MPVASHAIAETAGRAGEIVQPRIAETAAVHAVSPDLVGLDANRTEVASSAPVALGESQPKELVET